MYDTHGFLPPQNGSGVPGPTGYGPETGIVPDGAVVPEPEAFSSASSAHLAAYQDGNWQYDEDLARLLETSADDHAWAAPVSDASAAHRPSEPRRRRRRRRVWLHPAESVPWVWLISLVIAALTAVIVAMLSVLGGLIAYDPLRSLASPGHPATLAGCWPLLIHGPWLVASLSILRAALHRRHATHSWVVVVFFSAVAVVLCVAQAPKTLPGVAVAGIPPITCLVSFHQLVRQITLTSPPRHALNRQPPGKRPK